MIEGNHDISKRGAECLGNALINLIKLKNLKLIMAN